MKSIALIAAAGRSQRMNAFKPLLPLRDSTVIETAITTLLFGGAEQVIVMTGREAARMAARLETPDGAVRCIYNPFWTERDMFSSVLLGLQACVMANAPIFFLPGDSPLFRADTLRLMKQRMEETGADVVYPTHLGTRGHPVLLSTRLTGRILRDCGKAGMRGALERCAHTFEEVETSDLGVLLDADLPQDYALLCLLAEQPPTQAVGRHSALVARLAVGMAERLRVAGYLLNPLTVELAALLHDRERQQPRHADRMADRLLEAGQKELADIVRGHMILPPEAQSITETAVLYLADKMALEDEPVRLSRRFAEKLGSANNLVRKGASKNYEVACGILALFEQKIGPIDPVQMAQCSWEHLLRPVPLSAEC